MPTELLVCGQPITITQNTVYACPAVRALLFCQTAAATFVQSNEVGMGTTAPLALSAAGQAEVNGGFIKCTSGNVIIMLRKA